MLAAGETSQTLTYFCMPDGTSSISYLVKPGTRAGLRQAVALGETCKAGRLLSVNFA